MDEKKDRAYYNCVASSTTVVLVASLFVQISFMDRNNDVLRNCTEQKGMAHGRKKKRLMSQCVRMSATTSIDDDEDDVSIMPRFGPYLVSQRELPVPLET